MDEEKRIRELEAHIRRLNYVVDHLLEKQPLDKAAQERKRLFNEAQASTPPPPSVQNAPSETMSTRLVSDMRRQVNHALHGDEGEDIETHVGSVWLSRLAVIVTMTAVVLGARYTFHQASIGSGEKALIGYGVAALFIFYGLIFHSDYFSQAILGCGLASLYFTTYAIFFVPEMRIFNEPMLAIPLLIGCLLLFAGIAYWRTNQTVAGIGLFLAYYTVIVSCTQAPSLESHSHALATCAALALFTLFFHYSYRWLFLSWSALLATYITYTVFFLNQPEEFTLGATPYFWLSNGFLTAYFLLFSLTCITDARKTGEYLRSIPWMATLNTLIFFILIHRSLEAYYPAQQGAFRASLAAVLLFFAFLSETASPHRNYLFQVFIALAVIIATLALQAFLSTHREILYIAFATESFCLLLLYKHTSAVAFKLLSLLLMIVTTLACLANIKNDTTLTLGAFTLPSNWIIAAGVSTVFCINSWCYEKFIRILRPENRTSSGHWFFADTFFDIHPQTAALLSAACATLLVLALTIIQEGETLTLPFILTGESLLFAAIGLILMTPQIGIGSVLLLGAAHVCFHIFLWLPVQGFEEQENYLFYTLFLAGATYFGAYTWDRFLHRYTHKESEWEQQLLSLLPYLAATFLLITLLTQQLTPLYMPLSLSGVGVALIAIGLLCRYISLQASGILSLISGGVLLYLFTIDHDSHLLQDNYFLPCMLLLLLCWLLTERLFWFFRRQHQHDGLLRTILVTLACLLGAVSFHHWATPTYRVVCLLGLAVATLLLGVFFHESRYRWNALLLFVLVSIQGFLLVRELSEWQQLLTFILAALILLIVSWGYSRHHRRRRASHPNRFHYG